MNLQFNDSSITVAVVGCGGFVGSHLLDAIYHPYAVCADG